MAKILIVGGVAVGATAAARLSRLNKGEDEIIVFERDEHVSFANCGLPYYLGGEIQSREALLLQTPESFKGRYGVEVRTWNNVEKIHPEERKLVIRNVQTNETYEEKYDYLILSPGANPIVPVIKGAETAQNIFQLRNIADVDKIYEAVVSKQKQHALVVGGGFIGIEVAENLIERGFRVTLVDRSERILAPFDDEMAKMVENVLVSHDITIRTGTSVLEVKDQGEIAVLEDGTEMAIDFLVMAIGVFPEITLAKNAGLKIGETGAIWTNEYLRTSDPSIYAGGDAIEVTHFITGKPTKIPLAGPANRQGRIIADNIHGMKRTYKGSLGTAVLKVFEYTAASTGLNEKQLITEGYTYEALHIHRGNHAGYYPGSTEITLKLLFNPEDGRVYGAQAFGQTGTEKRIDVIATAIKGGLTVDELTEIELTYAPPYSSAKDPVNIAGYVATNMMDGSHKTFKVQDVDELVNQGQLIIDVRTPEEYELGHIPTSINIPLDDIQAGIAQVPTSDAYYIACEVGLRGYMAQQLLTASNKNAKVYNLSGGYKLYKQYNEDNSPKSFYDGTPEDEELPKCSIDDAEQIVALQIDARGLQCPGPILELKEGIEKISPGEHLEISATDRGFLKDVKAWCDIHGHKLKSCTDGNGNVKAVLQKMYKQTGEIHEKNRQTIVVFSNDYDKLIAALIIANGALAMGKEVSLFFTFWGLAALRKENFLVKNKTVVEKMFAKMLPKGMGKTSLSKMNYMGVGKQMMQGIMKNKNVMTPEELLNQYITSGGKIIACTMSMDVMGIKEEELVTGIEYAGVATYLQDAEEGFNNLFI